MAKYAVVTPVDMNGRIPIEHPAHPDGWVDVTNPDPDVQKVILTDDPKHVEALLAAIESEHKVRGTTPVAADPPKKD